MYAEAHRPVHLDEVFGHAEVKQKLTSYLKARTYPNAICLVGPPGIGKTTIVLCAAQTCGFEILELNASRALRSYEDVDRIRDSCRSSVSIASFLRGEPNKTTCVILDEVDGADPHAQTKLIDWIKDPKRRVPILCTGNEVPTIFKRNGFIINVIRCFPPCVADVQKMFPTVDIEPILTACQYDIRRVYHRLQYGVSYVIPLYKSPPTGHPPEHAFRWRQQMFGLPDPLEYRADRQDSEHWFQTIDECTLRGTDDRTAEQRRPRKLRRPGKSHTSPPEIHPPPVEEHG
jgi:hypothetical protein